MSSSPEERITEPGMGAVSLRSEVDVKVEKLAIPPTRVQFFGNIDGSKSYSPPLLDCQIFAATLPNSRQISVLETPAPMTRTFFPANGVGER